jgi:PAS domain S-box-containing protein
MQNTNAKKPVLNEKIARMLRGQKFDASLLEDLSAQELIDEIGRYQDLFEHAPVGYLVLDQELEIRQVNRAFRRLVHLEAQDLAGRPLEKIIHADSREAFSRGMSELQRQGQAEMDDITLLCGEGEKAVQLLCNQFESQGERLIRCTARDISSSKLNERQLRESEQRLQAVIDSQTNYLIRTDMAGCYTFWNDKYRQEYGWIHKGKMADAQALDAICLHHHPRVAAVVRECVAHPGQVFLVELDKPRQDGGVRTNLWEFVCLVDAHGRPSEMQCAGIDISQQKQLEAAQQALQTKLRLLFENLPTATAIYRMVYDETGEVCDLVFDEVNPLGLENMGLTAQQIAGKSATALFGSEVMQPYLELCREVRASGAPRTFETFFAPTHSYYVTRATLLGQDLYATISLDITQRQQAEEALRASEEKYRSLSRTLEERVSQRTAELRETQQRLELAIGAAKLGLFDADVPSGRVFFSPEYVHLLGCTVEEFGTDYAAFAGRLHPDDRPRVLADIENFLADPAPQFSDEFRMQHKDGSYRWHLTRAVIIRDEQGRPLRMLGMQMDIDRRKQAELALFESREDYRSLVDSLDSAIIKVDRDGRYLYVNGIAAGYLGLPPDQILGKTFLDLLTPAEAERNTANVHQVLDSGTGMVAEVPMEFVDGQQRWLRGSVQPVFNTEGQAVQAVIIATDISEIKQAQGKLEELALQLQAANASLEKALRARDEFLAAVSHELRTPLTGILGMAEALQYPHFGSLSERQLKAVVNIERSGKNLLELVNEVLDYTQIQSGRAGLQFRTCSLGDIFGMSLYDISGKAAAKAQKLETSVTPQDLRVEGDERRLVQILVNLLENAVKFTPEDGEISLVGKWLAQTREVQIQVRDSGIGIWEEDIPRLFQPFVQLDASLSRRYEGTGLGLALVKALVDLHGGSLAVESAPGLGSTFTVTLPSRLPPGS